MRRVQGAAGGVVRGDAAANGERYVNNRVASPRVFEMSFLEA